jgi:dihydroorotate dehydrogenase
MSWTARGYPWLRKLFLAMDSERAHALAIASLRHFPIGVADRGFPINVCGLEFPNPLGFAAGFDKDAEVPGAILGMGFGFVEVGTITPKPQSGNAKPRLFRLREDGAIINRMGFNSRGQDAALARLARRPPGVIGINIGANKDSTDRIADYVAGFRAFAPYASYIAVNVSSPNTPGLRNLQSKAELNDLLTRLGEVRATLTARPPLFLKIAPDLEPRELEDIAEVCLTKRADAIIVSNTTVSRPPLLSRHAAEAGGLSGAPLFALSTRQLARMYLITKGAIPLVGVGGVRNAETAWAKIEAGASLVELYTGLIYRGPGLVGEILGGFHRRMKQRGLTSIGEAVGARAEYWAHHGLSGT